MIPLLEPNLELIRENKGKWEELVGLYEEKMKHNKRRASKIINIMVSEESLKSFNSVESV